MAEYINREDLLNNLKQFAPEHLTPLIVMLIEKQPTADVVEVIRCKDCKHATFYSCKNDACYKRIICEYQIAIGDENFFCACGETRTSKEMVGETNDT